MILFSVVLLVVLLLTGIYLSLMEYFEEVPLMVRLANSSNRFVARLAWMRHEKLASSLLLIVVPTYMFIHYLWPVVGVALGGYR